MKSWDKLEPDQVKLLTKHFTPGRGGQKIQHVTLHHMAMIGGLQECWNVWQSREASAHYTVDPNGVIGQAVWDRDTPWANANLLSNQRTIAIEHSNSAGAASDWTISEKTREEGAHLVAAICKYYQLGRPVSGQNVRFHSIESGGQTGCPWHLRPGGKYHDSYIRRAQYWYDQMTSKKPAPAPQPKKVDDMTPEQDRIIRENNRLLKELRYQLTGSDQPGKFPGLPQSGNRTLYDLTSAIAEVEGVPGTKDIKQ